MGRAWVTGITIGLALAAAPLGAQQTDAPPVPSGSGTPPVERSTTQPRPATVLVAGDLRDGIDLSGPWHYSIDPFRSGIAGVHGEAPDPGQQRWREVDVRAAMARDSRTLYEFDLARSPLVFGFEIVGLSRQGAVVRFAYAGEREKFISSLRERGLMADADDLGWVMTSAVTRAPS